MNREKKQARCEVLSQYLHDGLASLLDAKIKLATMRKIYKDDIESWQLKNYELLTSHIQELIAVAKKINNVGRSIMAEYIDESDSGTIEDMLR